MSKHINKENESPFAGLSGKMPEAFYKATPDNGWITNSKNKISDKASRIGVGSFAVTPAIK